MSRTESSGTTLGVTIHARATSDILAIDPGPAKSAYVFFRAGRPFGFGWIDNAEMLNEVRASRAVRAELVIEQVQSFGMAVGAEVFETCFWAGRFYEAWGNDETAHMMPRKDVKLHLCQSLRAKDANIRQALLDRYGGRAAAIGSKKQPGPLYGIKTHAWSALALAVTFADTRAPRR